MLNPPSFHDFAKDPVYNQPPVARTESSVGQPYYQAGFPTANFGGGSLTETNVDYAALDVGMDSLMEKRLRR